MLEKTTTPLPKTSKSCWFVPGICCFTGFEMFAHPSNWLPVPFPQREPAVWLFFPTLYLSLHISLAPISTPLLLFSFSPPPHLRPRHLSSCYQCFTCSHLWLEDAAHSASFLWSLLTNSDGLFYSRVGVGWLGWLCQTRISSVQTVCLLFCCFTSRRGLSWAPRGRTLATRCMPTFCGLSVISVCAANPSCSYSTRISEVPTRGPDAPAEQPCRSLTGETGRPHFRDQLPCRNFETLEFY